MIDTKQVLGAAVLTVLHLAVGAILQCLHRLEPRYNAFANGVVGAAWIGALVLLIVHKLGPITGACSAEYWAGDSGTRACQLYKVTFIGAICGMSVIIQSR